MSILPAFIDKVTWEKWLGESIQEFSEVDGGLFNRVFHVVGKTHHIYVKHFTDQAKDPSFPPLPTTAQARYTVAVEVNHLADNIIVDYLSLGSAKIIGFDPDNQVIGLEAVAGVPLHELLVIDNELDKSRQIIHDITHWLTKFHAESRGQVDKIFDSAKRFKEYKTNLQYHAMLEHISPAIQASARNFIDAYSENTDTVLLGDLNSRNIIVNFPDAKIIDFEQGQIGEGVHDLAYITAELVIALIKSEVDPLEDISMLWQIYNVHRNYDELSFRRHLAFQTLYRLQGPSRKVWSGHLTETQHHKVFEWCMLQFKALYAVER